MRLLKRLLFMPGWLVLLIAAPSFALVFYVLGTGLTDHPLTYISYAASAYALVIACANAPRMLSAAKHGFGGHPLVRRTVGSAHGQRLLKDPVYRTELSLYAGLLINLLYAAVKLVSGIVFHSVWFGALAGYYLLLAFLRFALLQYARREHARRSLRAEWMRYRLCGIVLLVMNQALAVIVALVVYRNSGFAYPGYLIYVMALYTFYAVINAARNIGRFRNHADPVLQAAKAVSFVAALVSLLSLETAMLAQFSAAGEEDFRRIMTACTGGAVCTIVLGMAVFMIVRSTRQIRRLKKRPKK